MTVGVFLANRANLQARQLHRRIGNRFETDGQFETVRFRVAEPREPGPYRVTAVTDPQRFLDDPTYPVASGRLEVGFELDTPASHEFYWVNWIEPERNFLLGWHQDSDHEDLGPVHVQVNQDETAVEHHPATFLDDHPMAVLDARLHQLPDVLSRLQWEDGRLTGLDW